MERERRVEKRNFKRASLVLTFVTTHEGGFDFEGSSKARRSVRKFHENNNNNNNSITRWRDKKREEGRRLLRLSPSRNSSPHQFFRSSFASLARNFISIVVAGPRPGRATSKIRGWKLFRVSQVKRGDQGRKEGIFFRTSNIFSSFARRVKSN